MRLHRGGRGVSREAPGIAFADREALGVRALTGQRLKRTSMQALGESDDAAARLAASLRAVAERQDRAAFAPVFAFYAPRAKAYFRELGADDARAERLAEEAMLAVWRRADAFARGGADVGTWVFRLVRDTGIVGLQGRSRPDFDPDDPELVVPSYNPPTYDAVADPCAATDTTPGARERLPEEEMKLFRTFYRAPIAGSAPAAKTSSPPGAARLRLALDRLRGLFGAGR